MIESRQIIVFEPNFTGHRMDFCKSLHSYSLDSSIQMILATSSDALHSAEFHQRFGDSLPQIEDLGSLPDIRAPRYFRWAVRSIANLRKQFPNSEIIVLEGDKLVPALLMYSVPTRRLPRVRLFVMRAPERQHGRPVSVAKLKLLLLNLISSRGVQVVVLKPATPLAPSYRYRGFPAAPDPVDLAAPDGAKEKFRTDCLDESRTWVGIFGNITARKNLDVVATATSEAAHSTKLGLLIAGRLSREEHQRCAAALKLAEQAGVKIVLRLGLLPATELDTAIAAVDTVVVAHSGDGPSGIVGKAMASGTYVLAAGSTVLQQELAEFPTRGTFVALTASDIAAALDIVVESPVARVSSVKFADGSEFARSLLAT